MLFGAYIFTPVQFLLDYTFAYGVVGIAGLFAGQVKRAAKQEAKKTLIVYLVLGALLGSLLRYGAHVLSGIVFFAEYAEGPVVAYSFAYNMTYMLPSFLVSAVVLVLLFVSAPRFATLATRDVPLMRVLIVAASPEPISKLPHDVDYIIGVDGGYETLLAHGLTPHLVVGDFDSFTGEVPSDAVRYPSEKM